MVGEQKNQFSLTRAAAQYRRRVKQVPVSNRKRGAAKAMKTSLNGFFLLYFLALPIQSHAAAGDLDLSFDAGSSLDGAPSAIAIQRDGKIVIGGGFSTVAGLTRHRIARLDTDGTADATFDPGGG